MPFPSRWITPVPALIGRITDETEIRARLVTLEAEVAKACEAYLDDGYSPGTQTIVDAHGNVMVFVCPGRPMADEEVKIWMTKKGRVQPATMAMVPRLLNPPE